jgi:ABC-type uncharacterized transport system substrate-binding protein
MTDDRGTDILQAGPGWQGNPMHFDKLQRREFITLLGGAAAIWPFAAGAQQPSKIAKVGVLFPGLAASLPSRIAGLREGLQAAGYREPDNIELIPRAAEGDPKRIAALAMELAERKVDVMVPVSPAAIHAALAATTTIPSHRGIVGVRLSSHMQVSNVLARAGV